MTRNNVTQRVLFDMPSEQPYPALILSIRSMHVDKIFQGSKQFDLRKSVPNTQFRRVYLYESGTRKGFVGCFDAKNVYDSMPLNELWETVGELGTTKERFDAYFSGRQTGCAIEIANPIKFSTSVIPPIIKNKKPDFYAPVSYSILSPTEKLYTYLEAKRAEEMGSREIRLRLIEPPEYDAYKRMVTDVISKNYDDITEKFAESILRTHELGYDPRGIFTLRKEVYSIVAHPDLIIGFTTITYKIGGSAKTGPTVLFEEFRYKGYGKTIRELIEGICKGKGARKLYCTCADNQSVVFRYLLNGGMRVEAHLTDQYSSNHGEFVLGKLLSDAGGTFHIPNRHSAKPARVVKPEAFDENTLSSCIMERLQESGYDIDPERSLAIARSAKLGCNKSYEDKPLEMLCLETDDGCAGFALLIPKRGGSIKSLIACFTTHGESIDNLVVETEKRARQLNKRKIYVNHNIADKTIIERLVLNKYVVEGVLKQPYKSGVDHLILSKRLA